MCDGSCFQSFNSGTTELNSYVENAFKTFILLIGYFEDCFPQIFVAITVLSSIQLIFSFFSIIFFVYIAFNNPNRIQLVDSCSRNLNVLIWWKDQIFPFLVNLWIFWVSAIYIAFNYTWISSVSTTLILLHVWCEFPIFLILILLIKDKSISWKDSLRFIFLLNIGFTLNITLLALTSNPYIQGILDILAIVADFGNPIAFLIFLHYKFYELNTKDKIRFVLTTIIFWNHIFSFYLPIVLCVYPNVVSAIYLTFLIISIIENFTLLFFELATWENLSIPTVF